MTRQPITTNQFIAYSVLTTLAFAFLVLAQGQLPLSLILIPLQVATFVIMPAEAYKRPWTFRQVLVVVGVLLAIFTLIWWLATHATPESDAWARSVGHAFSHPSVAVPVWLLFLYLGYRRWRMKPPPREAPTHDHE